MTAQKSNHSSTPSQADHFNTVSKLPSEDIGRQAQENSSIESSGILLIDKPKNKTSFSLVAALRRLLKVQTIGHAGTLDPFATGVMVLLIGKKYTRMSDQLLCANKKYIATARLGIETDTYDCDGQIISQSDVIPSQEELVTALKNFQGEILQTPPMFSAKKKNGKKLYELARKGIVIDRPPVPIQLTTELISYDYPYVKLSISCSKGTYVRSIAYDLGKILGCGAHLSDLQRTCSGQFQLANCMDGALLDQPNCDLENLKSRLIKSLVNQ